jgi:DNA-binding MarR family transcriptional regulator
MNWHLQHQVCQNANEGFYGSANEFAVMRALASFADDGESCSASMEALAKRSQCSEQTVKRVSRKFRERGWITVVRTGRSNRYRILPHGWVLMELTEAC